MITPLLLSAKHGYIQVAGLLIDNGAHIGLQNHSGDTALLSAAGSGYTSYARLLIDKGALIQSRVPDWKLIVLYNTRAVTVLLDAGVHVDTKDHCGRALLAVAAEDGNVELTRMLLERGAVVDVKDRELSKNLRHFHWQHAMATVL